MLSPEILEKLRSLNWEIISENPFKAALYTQFTGTHELNSEREALEEIESFERFKKIQEDLIQRSCKAISKSPYYRQPQIISDKEILDWLEQNVNSITHDRMTNSVDMSGTTLSMTYRDSRNRNKRLRASSIRDAVEKAIKNE